MTATSLDVPASFRSSAARPGPLALVSEAAAEAWSRRRLIRYLVAADLKKHGADTVLGNLWWVVDPLLQMVVYVILVTIIFRRSQPDFPLFVFAALLPWKWFVSSVTDAIGSVTGQDRLIRQVQFPKIVLPIAAVFAGIVNFAFGLVPLLALLLLFYHDRASVFIVLLPVMAAVQLVFTMAFALVLAAVNVFFRDVTNVARHALRLWFYLTPVLYSAQQAQDVAKNHRFIGELMTLNPFYVLMGAYRDVVYDSRLPPWSQLAVLLAVSIVLLALATYVFKRLEPSFAKVL
jgi:ABC-type polysaccharide/polyol phosphate export permease